MAQVALPFDVPSATAAAQIAQLPSPFGDATSADPIASAIGRDFARHRLTPPVQHLQAESPVYQAWRAGRAAFGQRTLPGTPRVRLWLQLRLQAWMQGLVFEDMQLTPCHLQQLEVSHCPVTREPLTRATQTGTDGRVDRINHAAAFAAGNLAMLSAQACQARVNWRLVARAGLTTSQTLHLLLREATPHADVAVVVSGVNDVVDQVPSQRAVRSREAIANGLRNAHGVVHVVFAPLPPVHAFLGLPQPLRWVAGADAKRHNAALQDWVGTRSDVSCVDMHLDLHKDRHQHLPTGAALLASDGFHPGAAAYRHFATAIAQHIATHVWPQLQPEPAP